MQTLDFHTMNVFTHHPFTGNPLAIVLDADALSDQQMQTMAREFNLPETIFIQSPVNKAHTAKVRIFTPATELPFAGHPTIGCAIFLAQQQNAKLAEFSTQILLEEEAGLVPVNVVQSNGKVNAQLSAPVIPEPAAKPADTNDDIKLDAATAACALGIAESDVDTRNSQPMAHTGGPTFLLVPLTNKDTVAKVCALEPMSTDLSQAYAATGIYVYYLDTSTKEIDARMFAPAAGIPEDPATGSATALLASQLLESNQLSNGENEFILRQGYDMGRPSDLLLSISVHDNALVDVKVSGSCTPISSGKMRIPSH